jgi:hypothetical protein
MHFGHPAGPKLDLMATRQRILFGIAEQQKEKVISSAGVLCMLSSWNDISLHHVAKAGSIILA